MDWLIFALVVGGLGWVAWTYRYHRSHPNYEGDLEKAYLAVRYLMSRDPAEAQVAAEALLARLPAPAAGQKDELQQVRRQVESLKRSAEYQARQAEEEARSKAARAARPVGRRLRCKRRRRSTAWRTRAASRAS